MVAVRAFSDSAALTVTPRLTPVAAVFGLWLLTRGWLVSVAEVPVPELPVPELPVPELPVPGVVVGAGSVVERCSVQPPSMPPSSRAASSVMNSCQAPVGSAPSKTDREVPMPARVGAGAGKGSSAS